MSRKVYAELTVRLVLVVDEGEDVQEVLSEMNYSFADTTGTADIIDTEILTAEITDSK